MIKSRLSLAIVGCSHIKIEHPNMPDSKTVAFQEIVTNSVETVGGVSGLYELIDKLKFYRAKSTELDTQYVANMVNEAFDAALRQIRALGGHAQKIFEAKDLKAAKSFVGQSGINIKIDLPHCLVKVEFVIESIDIPNVVNLGDEPVASAAH